MEGYIAEIRMFAGNFAPRNWAFCQGQLLSIAQNTALFSLIGTIYGGNGQTTFALPDLRGRVALGVGQGPGLSNYDVGQVGGVESVTLATTQIPAHSHPLNGSNSAGTSNAPTGNYPAVVTDPTANPMNAYGTAAPIVAMNAASVGNTGGSQPHTNLQPHLAVSYIICLAGIFPSRN